MDNIFNVTLLGLLFGTFGTTLGGIIGINFKKPSNKFLSFILSFASGLMMAIVTFDLIPEALKISTIPNVVMGTIIGMICMIFCNIIVDNKFRKFEDIFKSKNTNIKNKELLKTGIITSIGLAIHNLPEGLAIGAGFGSSMTLGYSLAIAICIHDIPEGISMAVPMKNGGMNSKKVMFYVILSGMTTGIGALIGKIVGEISEELIAMSLAFAAGAMLYIVCQELIPESKKLSKGLVTIIGCIIGLILGLIAVNI